LADDIVESGVHVGTQLVELADDIVESGVHVGTQLVELADDIVESGVLGLTVVVNHDRASLCEYEIVCGMGRSVTQAVLWLSSTHKPKGC
jgi:hypothetical protein